MKASLISSSGGKRRQAMALIMVITTVALMSILIVAIFSVTRTEYKSTQAFVAGKSAKQLGDIGTAIVQAQIQNAQNTLGTAQRTTHATQPGMARVYNADGSFNAAFKLYSSSQMKVTGDESALYSDQHVAPSNWSTLPARYADLNEPVVRPGLPSGAGATYAVYFPVLDPRAAWNYGSGGQNAGADGKTGTTQVEGFSYGKSPSDVGGAGSQNYATKVVTPTDTSSPDNLRLPMPVEWLYLLEDGTVGALDSSNKFISAGGGSGSGSATKDNPIVGRVAFWADDESSKININTAAEPTYMSSPYYYHQRDAKWAHFPAVTGEYQRYPGHPATVALSAVLAPNYLLDPLLPSVDGMSGFMDVVNLKEQIYKYAPKITGGGSEAGTRPFVQDDLSSQNGERNASLAISLTAAANERLYASVDEMLFQDPLSETSPPSFNATNGRVQATISLPNGGRSFFDHDTLERSRFFLTAHSRSPEFSIHGLPRVCMWPIPDESKTNKWRTSFDNMIALCATIKKKSSSAAANADWTYFFRRAVARSGSYDVMGSGSGYGSSSTLSRNNQLLDYLVSEMSQLSFPGTAYNPTTTKNNFLAKYGQDNVNQLAIQFFDYIRSTNLYDGILARNNDAWSTRNSFSRPATEGGTTAGRYNMRDSLGDTAYTYTSQRVSEPPRSITISGDDARNNQRTAQGEVLPGHGQVSPAVWEKNGRSYKGFGRMFTISEIGFQFFCTADGLSGPGALNTFPTAQPHGKGGGTARLYEVNPGGAQPSAAAAYPGKNVTGADAYYWSNFPPLITQPQIDAAMGYYGCQAARTSPANLHPSAHPGFDPLNWNMTLAAGVPLLETQKRVQVMLMLETFCPSLGYTSFFPEFTIVLNGDKIGQMKLNGERLFNTTGDVPIKSYNNIYGASNNGAHPVGGHAPPSSLAGGRHTRNIALGGGTVLLPKDINYDNGNTSGHNALQNFAFVSDFITVDRNSPMQVTFPGGDIKIEIYDTHDWERAKPVQVLNVNFDNVVSTIPVPDLPQSRPYSESEDQYGRITYRRTLPGPHYWCGNYEGCLGRMTGKVNPNYGRVPGQSFWSVVPVPTPSPATSDAQGLRVAQAVRGRLDTTARIPLDPRLPLPNVTSVSIIADGTSDVIRTLVPAMGDYRTLAAMYNVPSSWWKPHPFWTSNLSTVRQAHSFTGFWANSEPGSKLAETPNSSGTYSANYNKNLQLVGGASFDLDARGNPLNTPALHGRQADLPPDSGNASAANSFGDFDTGISSAREGPYINKPDEGNFYAGFENRGGRNLFWRSSYFFETYQNAEDWRSGIYMTPNRLISSPVMFGSLPTGVWGNPSGLPSAPGSQDFAPWQTLLFRPHAFVSSVSPNSNNSHPGLQNPSDHYLLDLFFMPVVEPYAISEPLSVAGRVNMNYQIMPFTNIRRATGLHAVMKGEYITAIPSTQVVAAKEYYPGQATWSERFWDDKNDKVYWHRPVDVATTLRQFDLKFAHKSGGQKNYQGLFRSASQICEMHLIPVRKQGANSNIINPADLSNANSQTTFNSEMSRFWGENRPTGDNVRERPYSNLYARLTTRSNTFRVHVRAQVLKKARSTAPDTFDPLKDAIVGEYRGSSLLERYIDPNIDPTDTSSSLPDYAKTGINQAPLDTYYRFRVLENKRFNP